MLIFNRKTGKPYVQKRRRRYEGGREPRELTFTCYHRYRFLTRERTRNWFIEAMNEFRSHWKMDLWAYVIMPEHVHLIVSPRRRGKDVAKFQSAVKEQVGRKALNWLAANAPTWIPKLTVREGKRTRRRFWQAGGGYDRNVIQIESLLEMIRYVHANPIRRDLAMRATDWEWSSARWYAGVRPVAIEMDATLPMMYE